MLKNNQRGSTMLEAMGALSVVTVFTIAAISLVSSMFDMFKQNMVANEIKEIQKLITSRFQLEGSYEDLFEMDVDELKKEKLLPSQMFINNKIYHRLGGEVKISESDKGKSYYNITFNDLNNRTCLNLAQIEWIVNQGSYLVELKINKNVFKMPISKNNIEPGSDNALPMNLTKASKSCDDDDNTITWTFQ